MNNESYTTVLSDDISRAEQTTSLSLGFTTCYATAHKTVVNDTHIEGPLFQALLWDYFHQHFYEWVRL